MIHLHHGEALDVLRRMEDESFHCCVTSPPYWNIRDYGVDGQIGQEETPEEYVSRLVAVFREVKRVLRDDGTLWLNLGDSYASSGKVRSREQATACSTLTGGFSSQEACLVQRSKIVGDLKEKDLVGIPWMVAFALRADGWWLRSDNIWAKPAPLPSSVTDRTTSSHEHVFMLSKSARYFFDADAIAEPAKTWGERDRSNGKYTSGEAPGPGPIHRGLKGKRRWDEPDRNNGKSITEGNERHAATNLHRSLVREKWIDPAKGEPFKEGDRKQDHTRVAAGFNARYAEQEPPTTRNKRDVWTIASEPFDGAHFAVMPTELARTCILAGSPPQGRVLDPFVGAGTVPLVAQRSGRSADGIDLNRGYLTIARDRIWKDAPLLSVVQVVESPSQDAT